MSDLGGEVEEPRIFLPEAAVVAKFEAASLAMFDGSDQMRS